MERRLAAVLIADVVGYSRLSQSDEEGTRARFQADLRDVIEPSIATHRGRIVKTMGDGVLAEFQSVVQALRCAVEIQRRETERNAELPAERKLEFRIAINLGDLIVEGDDIHGTGVNIAERLQALAPPGGVVVSGTAYDHLTNRLEVDYEFLGEQPIKNIAEPVRVYRVLTGDAPAALPAVAATKTLPLVLPPGKLGRRRWGWPALAAAAVVLALAGGTALWWRPGFFGVEPEVDAALATAAPSLAVLPFDNLGDDKEQGYLAAGIAEDLTTELARMPGLFVVSRNAAFSYKGTQTSPRAIGRELGVHYLLEGSVRRVGDALRINAQLVEAASGGHVWAERFDGAWSDVFKLQDEVLEHVAMALKLRLAPGGIAEAAGGTEVTAAYDAYLKGLELANRTTREDNARAAEFYRRAVALDPTFGRAWADLAWTYFFAWGDAEMERALGVASDEVLATMNRHIAEAAKYPSPSYYQLVASILVLERASDAAINAAQRAIALDPSDPYSYEAMSIALIFNGRPADGKEYLDTTLRVDPRPTVVRPLIEAQALFGMDRFEDAVAALDRIDPQADHPWAGYERLFYLTSATAHLGRAADAARARAELAAAAEARGETATLLSARTRFPYKAPADTERLLEGLREAGVPELPLGLAPRSAHRLSGADIQSLIFGHEIRGRVLESGESWVTRIAADGSTTTGVGAHTVEGLSRIEGDAVCAWFPTVGSECAVVFRNPHGTPEQRNQYRWIRNDGAEFEFSVAA